MAAPVWKYHSVQCSSHAAAHPHPSLITWVLSKAAKMAARSVMSSSRSSVSKPLGRTGNGLWGVLTLRMHCSCSRTVTTDVSLNSESVLEELGDEDLDLH